MNIAQTSTRLAVVGLFLAASAHNPALAKIETRVGGGDLEAEGYLRAESRFRIEDDSYMTQEINRFQIETAWNFEDAGPFQELGLVAVIRAEWDAVNNDSDLSRGHIGRGSDKPSYLGIPFTAENDPIGYNGFNVLFGTDLRTGGLFKNVREGIWPESAINEFEVIAHETRFPLYSPTSDRPLNCRNCTDIDLSYERVGQARTDASGALYPFRELYLDAVAGPWWLRLGKQQVVWGKTDFFRLQDIYGPPRFARVNHRVHEG